MLKVLILLLLFSSVPSAQSFATTKNPTKSLNKVDNLLFSSATTIVALESRKRNEEDIKDEETNFIETLENNIYIEEPRILACDLLAILIAAQILGLSDVFLSSDFWKLGGLIQPITLSSFSTIAVLDQAG
jgi:hypothetical protein